MKIKLMGWAVFIALSLSAMARVLTVDAVFSRGPNYALPATMAEWWDNYEWAQANGLSHYGTGPMAFSAVDTLHPLDVLAGFPPEIPPNWNGEFDPTGDYTNQQGSSGYYIVRIRSDQPDLYVHQFGIFSQFTQGNGDSMNVESLLSRGVRPDGTQVVGPDWNEPLRELTLVQRFGFDFSTPSNQTNQTIGELRLAAVLNALAVAPLQLEFTVQDYDGRVSPITSSILISSSSEVPEPSTWTAIIAVSGIALRTGYRAYRSRNQK